MNKQFKKLSIKFMNVLMLLIIIGGVIPVELVASAIEDGLTTEKTPDKEGETTSDKEEQKTRGGSTELEPKDKETPNVETPEPDNAKEEPKVEEATSFIKLKDGEVDNPLVNQQKATEIDILTGKEVEIPVEYNKNNRVKRSLGGSDFVTQTRDFEVTSKKEIDTVFTQKRSRRSVNDIQMNDEILSNEEVLNMLGINVKTKLRLRSSPGYEDVEKVISISEDERSNLIYARQLPNVERDQVVDLRIDDPITNKRTTIPINFRLKGERTLTGSKIQFRGFHKKFSKWFGNLTSDGGIKQQVNQLLILMLTIVLKL